MKKMILPMLALVLFGFSTDTGKLTEEERRMANQHLAETRDHMLDVLDGLTDEQLNFKPGDGSWSIAEGVEHLAILETTFGDLVHKSVADGPNPELKDSLVFKDEQIMPMVTDRSNKVKTSEAFEPSGKFGSHEETLQAFLEKRSELMDYVKTTDDDLRNRFNSDFPFGTVDALQLIIFTAAHTERHVLQMEEVMAHADFPE
ncbi:DinB family protein [Flagellimonas baculiformis]|uniref:DinB family protein n=1 Tax=Flagellimonas baculiformis TaxID=3067310 RepID=UPI00296E9796|nr:DinB family protein [Muricauda sp. D6]